MMYLSPSIRRHHNSSANLSNAAWIRCARLRYESFFGCSASRSMRWMRSLLVKRCDHWFYLSVIFYIFWSSSIWIRRSAVVMMMDDIKIFLRCYRLAVRKRIKHFFSLETLIKQCLTFKFRLQLLYTKSTCSYDSSFGSMNFRKDCEKRLPLTILFCRCMRCLSLHFSSYFLCGRSSPPFYPIKRIQGKSDLILNHIFSFTSQLDVVNESSAIDVSFCLLSWQLCLDLKCNFNSDIISKESQNFFLLSKRKPWMFLSPFFVHASGSQCETLACLISPLVQMHQLWLS